MDASRNVEVLCREWRLYNVPGVRDGKKPLEALPRELPRGSLVPLWGKPALSTGPCPISRTPPVGGEFRFEQGIYLTNGIFKDGNGFPDGKSKPSSHLYQRNSPPYFAFSPNMIETTKAPEESTTRPNHFPKDGPRLIAEWRPSTIIWTLYSCIDKSTHFSVPIEYIYTCIHTYL